MDEQPFTGPGEAVDVSPVVVLSRRFPARPSSIPEIREFVRRSLADAPLSDADTGAVSQTVFRALLDAAGPDGEIQISFRIFPEQVEVDVLHSGPGTAVESALASMGGVPLPEPSAPSDEVGTFAEWMSAVLRREGLNQEEAARQLGVSVRTVGRWLGGQTEPRLRDLRRIRERFGGTPLP